MTEAWKDHIFTNLGTLPLRPENADDGYTVEDLVPYGWAPGGYVGPCRECREFFVAAKRSWRCRPCAVTSLEAYRNRPTWQSGHKGIPTDRDVWAWKYSHDTSAVELLRGRDVDGEFMREGETWPDDFGLENVICWIDVEDRPELSAEAVNAIVESLPDLSGCLDHIVEDWLHLLALQAVADGHRDARAIAAAALKSRELKSPDTTAEGTMRIYTETPFRVTAPRQAIVIPAEACGPAMLEAQRRVMDRDIARVRARMKQDILSPLWRQLYEDFATTEACAEAMRPTIGKALSRRARRRNRGRVRAAKATLMRRFCPSVKWAWPDPDQSRAA